MATGNLDSAVKGEEYLSLKLEDNDGGTFDDDYSNDFLAGLATISNPVSQVRDEVYQRCGKPRKGHGSQCSKPYTHRRSRPYAEDVLVCHGGMAKKHIRVRGSRLHGQSTLEFSRARTQALSHSLASSCLRDQTY